VRRALAALVLLAACGGWAHWTPPPPPASPVVPRDPPAGARLHYALALSAWLDGDLPLARTEVAVALLLDPDSAWLRMTEGRIAAEQGDLTAARRAFEEALRRDPDLAEAREALAALEARPPAGGAP